MGRSNKQDVKYAIFTDILKDVKSGRVNIDELNQGKRQFDRNTLKLVIEILDEFSVGRFPDDFKYDSSKERVKWGNIAIYIKDDKNLFVQMLIDKVNDDNEKATSSEEAELPSATKNVRLNLSLRDVMIKDYIARSGATDRACVYSEIINGLILGKIKNNDIIVAKNQISEIRGAIIQGDHVIFERTPRNKPSAKPKIRRRNVDIVLESFKKYVSGLEKLYSSSK